MNIKRAKQEIKDAVQAYLMKDEYGEYQIPAIHQRPILLMGPPGIGKTQIMEQISRECEIGLVAYTITHHTRQSAIGLPFIQTKIYGGKEYSVTEYTMSEIIAAVYEKIEQSGMKEGILFIDEINCVSETLAPTMLQFLQCKMFGNQSVPEDISPIRGGTDGCKLSFKGLPCPNLGTGGHGYHGPLEHVTIEGMEAAVRVIVELVKIFANE